MVRYQGGKRRSAKQIASALAALHVHASAPGVGDLFLGSCGIEVACAAAGAPVTLGSEVCLAVVACLRAVRDGWEPPATLSADEYMVIRARCGPDSDDPLAAFALAFCSYGGKWAAGLIKDDVRWSGAKSGGASRSAAAKARRDLLALRPLLQQMQLECLDYREAAKLVPDGGVLYLDPPWRGTEPYRQAPPFDVDAFWTWAEAASRRWLVLVSEGPNGPPPGAGWTLVRSWGVVEPGLARGKVECLWTHRGGHAAQILGLSPGTCKFLGVSSPETQISGV